MADYRNDPSAGDDRTLQGGAGMNRAPETDPEHLLPDHTHAAAPGSIAANDDPTLVRGEIERTRARMSQTIDQLEGVLLRKKDEIQERLDFTAPVRQNPWAFTGGVFGAGLLLGFATGGKKDDVDDDHVKIPRALLEGIGLEEAGRRGKGRSGSGAPVGEWEDRSRELMRIVARQDEEIRDLRAALYGGELGDGGLVPDQRLDGSLMMGSGAADDEEEWDEEWNFDDEEDDFGDMTALGAGELDDEGGFHVTTPVAAAVAAGVAALVGGAAMKAFGGPSSKPRAGMDVEVELEPRSGAATDVRVDEGFRATRRSALGPDDPPLAEGRTGTGYASGERYTGTDYAPRAAGYGATEGRAAYSPPPGPAYTGRREMEVEVELERPRGGSRPKRSHELPVSPAAAAIATGVTALVAGLVTQLLRTRHHGHEMDVEVELEQPTGYRPSAQPQPRQTSQPSRPAGEMEVEVELEQRPSQLGSYRTSLHTPSAGSAPGAAGTQPAATGREYQVELENDRARGDDADPWGGGTGTNAPLM